MYVSVVMATYNGEKFIIHQLNSILNQTRLPDEVLIFDDGSTDSTCDLVKNFIKGNLLKNWKFTINGKNLGFRNNFEQGLQRSSGDIVFLCDQDDVWKKNKIEVMSKIMESKEVLSLASSFSLIDENGKNIICKLETGKSNNNLLDFSVEKKSLFQVPTKFLLRKNFAQGCTMAVKRELIESFLKDNIKTLEHDWSLSLIASLKNGCYFYNESLIYYRIHGNNEIGLKQIFETKNQQKQRINQRVIAVREEEKRIDFILQYSYQYLFLKKFYTFRLECFDKKQITKLIQKCIFGEFKKVANLRAIIGDVVSILKKS